MGCACSTKSLPHPVTRVSTERGGTRVNSAPCSNPPSSTTSPGAVSVGQQDARNSKAHGFSTPSSVEEIYVTVKATDLPLLTTAGAMTEEVLSSRPRVMSGLDLPCNHRDVTVESLGSRTSCDDECKEGNAADSNRGNDVSSYYSARSQRRNSVDESVKVMPRVEEERRLPAVEAACARMSHTSESFYTAEERSVAPALSDPLETNPDDHISNAFSGPYYQGDNPISPPTAPFLPSADATGDSHNRKVSFESDVSVPGLLRTSSSASRLLCRGRDGLPRLVASVARDTIRKGTRSPRAASPHSPRTRTPRRPRLASCTEMGRHPDDMWWSDAHMDIPTITNDMKNPRILSRAVKSRVALKPEEQPTNILDYFFHDLELDKSKKYVIYRLGLGDRYCMTLSEVTDESLFVEAVERPNFDWLLKNRLKFILAPANLPFPLPLKGPKGAEPVGSYWSMKHVDMSRQVSSERHPGVDCTTVTVELYARWIIKKMLPTCAFSAGRVCDFFLLDYDSGIVYSSFRMICTEKVLKLLKDS